VPSAACASALRPGPGGAPGACAAAPPGGAALVSRASSAGALGTGGAAPLAGAGPAGAGARTRPLLSPWWRVPAASSGARAGAAAAPSSLCAALFAAPGASAPARRPRLPSARASSLWRRPCGSCPERASRALQRHPSQLADNRVKRSRCTCAPALHVSIPDQATLHSALHALPRHALIRAGGIDVGLHPSASGGPRLTSCAARTCSAGRPAPVLLKKAFFTDARAFSSRPRRVGQCSTLRSAPEGRVNDAGHRAGAGCNANAAPHWRRAGALEEQRSSVSTGHALDAGVAQAYSTGCL